MYSEELDEAKENFDRAKKELVEGIFDLEVKNVIKFIESVRDKFFDNENEFDIDEEWWTKKKILEYVLYNAIYKAWESGERVGRIKGETGFDFSTFVSPKILDSIREIFEEE